jgi:hypothetical protein
MAGLSSLRFSHASTSWRCNRLLSWAMTLQGNQESACGEEENGLGRESPKRCRARQAAEGAWSYR